MRAAAFSVLSPLGALLALGILLAPHQAQAAATFTKDSATPFVSSITLWAGSEVITLNAKTQQDIRVVVSIDPGTTPGIGYTIDSGSDSHLFTENGTFTFRFHDTLGNVGSSTVTIDNIDRTPPEITVAPFATTSTNADVSVSASTNEGTLNASLHTFTENGSFDFVATDEAGNISTSTVTVSNIDKVAPTISLVGNAALQVNINNDFSDPGATATDDVDGVLTPAVSGSVNKAVLGTYVLIYTATDAAGNIASTSRTVEVVKPASGGGGGGSSRVLTQATVGQVLGASTYNFTRDLSYKQKGADVTALQEILAREGFLKETPTGYFGTLTQSALKAYQKAHGISQTGVLGPVTRAALSQMTAVSPLSTSTQIALLIAKLTELRAQLALLSS